MGVCTIHQDHGECQLAQWWFWQLFSLSFCNFCNFLTFCVTRYIPVCKQLSLKTGKEHKYTAEKQEEWSEYFNGRMEQASTTISGHCCSPMFGEYPEWNHIYCSLPLPAALVHFELSMSGQENFCRNGQPNMTLTRWWMSLSERFHHSAAMYGIHRQHRVSTTWQGLLLGLPGRPNSPVGIFYCSKLQTLYLAEWGQHENKYRVDGGTDTDKGDSIQPLDSEKFHWFWIWNSAYKWFKTSLKSWV